MNPKCEPRSIKSVKNRVWEMLAKNKLGIWHNIDKDKIKKFRRQNLFTKIDENLFLKNLRKIGYNNLKGFKSDKNTKLLTLAFQRRLERRREDVLASG